MIWVELEFYRKYDRGNNLSESSIVPKPGRLSSLSSDDADFNEDLELVADPTCPLNTTLPALEDLLSGSPLWDRDCGIRVVSRPRQTTSIHPVRALNGMPHYAVFSQRIFTITATGTNWQAIRKSCGLTYITYITYVEGYAFGPLFFC